VKISPQSPKTEYGIQNQYGRVIYTSIGNFVKLKKKYTYRVIKSEYICIQSPKTRFGLQNQFGRMIYPSIGNFIEEKINTFRGQKAKSRIYKPSEPKYDRFFLHLHSWNKAMLGIQSNGPRILKGS
jgi:hypothetical protein